MVINLEKFYKLIDNDDDFPSCYEDSMISFIEDNYSDLKNGNFKPELKNIILSSISSCAFSEISNTREEIENIVINTFYLINATTNLFAYMQFQNVSIGCDMTFIDSIEYHKELFKNNSDYDSWKKYYNIRKRIVEYLIPQKIDIVKSTLDSLHYKVDIFYQEDKEFPMKVKEYDTIIKLFSDDSFLINRNDFYSKIYDIFKNKGSEFEETEHCIWCSSSYNINNFPKEEKK